MKGTFGITNMLAHNHLENPLDDSRLEGEELFWNYNDDELNDSLEILGSGYARRKNTEDEDLMDFKQRFKKEINGRNMKENRN